MPQEGNKVPVNERIEEEETKHIGKNSNKLRTHTHALLTHFGIIYLNKYSAIVERIAIKQASKPSAFRGKKLRMYLP